MRKALVIFLCFLAMYGVGACTYSSYMNHQEELELAEIGYRNSTIIGNRYTVQVRSKVYGRPISGYEYEIEDRKLYLTVFYRSSGNDLMEIYKDEYVKIDFKTEEEFDYVYYRDKNKDSELTAEQYLKIGQFSYKDLSLSADGVFNGKFRCDLEGKNFYQFTQKVEDDGNLYITLSCSNKNSMQLDSEGYGSVEAITNRDVNKVYFRNGNELLLLVDKSAFDYGQITTRGLTLYSNGDFSGMFSSDLDGKQISDYDYVVENGNLYITLYRKASGAPTLNQDADGYVTVSISTGKKVEKVYYRYFNTDSEMTVTNKS
jgi:hypothetical protein